MVEHAATVPQPRRAREASTRNRRGRSAVSRVVELLLIVLLVLMIPGLVTYLRPTRDTSGDRVDS